MAGSRGLTHGGEDVQQWKLQELSVLKTFEIVSSRVGVAQKLVTLELAMQEESTYGTQL